MSQTGPSVHDFELTLEGADELTPEIADALFAAGCDDASLSGRGPILTLTFHREAPSFQEALVSATADVVRTGLGLAVTRVVKLSTFTFDVVLSGESGSAALAADALARGGCDDATPKVCCGALALRFDRLDESLGDAVGRALKNVERAGLAVTRVEVESPGS